MSASLAIVLRQKGWHVAGTCRSETRQKTMRKRGIEAYIFDGVHSMDVPQDAITAANYILCSIPPSEAGDPGLLVYRSEITAARNLCWIGYLSTTGVYGNRNGAEVDEHSTVQPTSERGRRRVDAETSWLEFGEATGHNVQVFRLAGIYGPNRNVIIRVRAGFANRIQKKGHVFSRIHVDDVVATLCSSMSTPRRGAIYNVCDDEPASQSDVVEFACKLLGTPVPRVVPFEEACKDMSEMSKTFWVDDRQVSNNKIKTELGVTLSYPTYREGLASLFTG